MQQIDLMADGSARVGLSRLAQQLHDWLHVPGLRDGAPNGLQIEGREDIGRLAVAVTASQRVVDAAIDAGADALLVHHGYFWKNESATLTGPKGRRIAALLRANISLFAYHLPLDVHVELGNNAELAELLAARSVQQSECLGVAGLLWHGELEPMQSANALADLLAQRLQRQPLLIASEDNRPVRRLAWCSGGAQDAIVEAAALGADAFISGEISERSTHLARELGVHYLAAGHYATETGGVRRLAQRISRTFGVQSFFIAEDNPV